MQLHVLSLLILAAATAASTAIFSNYDPQRMLCAVNRVRVRHGLSPLGYDSRLEQLATDHCEVQGERARMGHDGQQGSESGDRIFSTSSEWIAAGENVAYGQDDQDSCLEQWMQSPGHRRNILSPDFTHFGSAAVLGADQLPYFSQEFAGDGQTHEFPVCLSEEDGGVVEEVVSQDISISTPLFTIKRRHRRHHHHHH